jgi:glycosyltransferase involved in cell wall biosynthesis
LRSVLDLVPFGLPAAAPQRSERPGPRAAFGIGSDEELILWNGGLWNWLDAPTALRAVALLAERRPQVRLAFMGASTSPAGRQASDAARRIAAELGVLDRIVFFNDRWVAYDERSDWLLDADCAISTQLEHLETRFAFRTRLLDCFWARLPVVCTRGDDLAALVEARELGATAAENDHVAVAAALERVLSNGRSAYAARLAGAAESFTWARVAEPLVRYATAGRPAARSRAPLGGRRPLHAARAGGYRLGRAGLNVVGLRDWPTL